jgi:hypothetical protein
LKRFFEPESGAGSTGAEHTSDLPAAVATHDGAATTDAVSARIAIYDDLRAAPRVEEIEALGPRQYIEVLSTRAYELARGQGGSIPYTVVREVVENLIHARFSEVVVSILDGGATMRFSDHGPGIEDKERSLAPGFSTATQEMKDVIRGVGSGLPIVKEYLAFSGGYVTIEDNLGTGTVVTLRLDESAASEQEKAPSVDMPAPSVPRLSTRQKRVLSLAMEMGSIGPSAVQRELEIALSTAYRDLAHLEEEGLLVSDEQGKRSLTDTGVSYLDSLFAG